MPDADNLLSESEKLEGQKRWDERLATIKATTTDAINVSLKTVWLQGKLFDDMLRDSRTYGIRTVKEICNDLNVTEAQLQWLRALYEQYNEADIEAFSKSGLGWCEVYALLHFRDFGERDDARARLVEKKIDWRQALEEAGRADRRAKERCLKERALEYEKKKREDLANNPAAHVRQVFDSSMSRMSVTFNMLERVWLSYMEYRKAIDKMGYFHRLTILTRRQACIEVIQYYSRQFAALANHIVQRVPDLIPDAQPQEPIPFLPESANLWRDLRECKLQLPNNKLGKGYTTIANQMERFLRTNPEMDERLAAVNWGIDQFLKMPEDDGKVMCRQKLAAVHKSLCTSQRMFADIRSRLAQ